jgi:hypothetical protein
MRLRGSVAVMPISLAAIMLLAACAGSDPNKEYFASVRAARALTAQNFENFNSIFGRTWPLRQALIAALEEAGVGVAFDGTVEALQGITPPTDLETDHELLLAATTELARLDQQAADAVNANDLISFSLYNGQMGIAVARMLGQLSPAYCLSLSEPGEDPAAACQPQDPLPGGTYGAELHEELRAFTPAIGLAGSGAAFALSLSPEEIAEIIRTEIPQVVSLLEDTRERIEALTPTDEFEADHDLLLAFFDAQSEAIQQLTTGQSDINAITIKTARMDFGEQLEQLFQGLVNDDFGTVISPMQPLAMDSSE